MNKRRGRQGIVRSTFNLRDFFCCGAEHLAGASACVAHCGGACATRCGGRQVRSTLAESSSSSSSSRSSSSRGVHFNQVRLG